MINRELEAVLKALSTKMPVISLTGPRQSGKSTLAKHVFHDYRYVNLEDLELRSFAAEDPKGFLAQYPYPLVIDEAQYASGIFSYIQLLCDEIGKDGMFVLTGSQDFLLAQKVSQSLAGRVAILHLLPFSFHELAGTEFGNNPWEYFLFTGFYPRIYDKNLDATKWYGDYVQTYLERDVRTIVSIGDIAAFRRFLSICAGRTGRLIDMTAIGNETGVSYKTVGRWLSVLEATNIITLLKPYHRNFNKRIVKTPKLYFSDTGLASFLLGIRSVAEVANHFARGTLFENLVISEIMKTFYNRGEIPPVYFWRDRSGHEVDCIVEIGGEPFPVEIKAGRTFNSDFLQGLHSFLPLSGMPDSSAALIYGGNVKQRRHDIKITPWNELRALPFSVVRS